MIDRMKGRSRVRHINRHLSPQVGITTSSRTGSRGNTSDPDTSELNTRAWSSHLMPIDTTFLLTGLCPQSLCTTLKDVLRRYKSQMASESDLLPHTTKLSQFWVLLHGHRGWYRGLGGEMAKDSHQKIYSSYALPGYSSRLKSLVANWSPSTVESKREVSEIKKKEEILLKCHNSTDCRKTNGCKSHPQTEKSSPIWYF